MCGKQQNRKETIEETPRTYANFVKKIIKLLTSDKINE